MTEQEKLDIRAELEAEREALLKADSTKKEDVELAVKAQGYAKGAIKSFQEVLQKAGVKITKAQAIIIQEEILADKLAWLKSQKAPEPLDEIVEGWDLAS